MIVPRLFRETTPTQPSNFHVTISCDVSYNLQPANFLSTLYFLPTDGVAVRSATRNTQYIKSRARILPTMVDGRIRFLKKMSQFFFIRILGYFKCLGAVGFHLCILWRILTK